MSQAAKLRGIEVMTESILPQRIKGFRLDYWLISVSFIFFMADKVIREMKLETFRLLQKH